MPSSGERVYKMVLSHFDSHIAFKISTAFSGDTEHAYIHLFQKSL